MRKNYFLGLLFGGIFCVFSVTSCSKVATPKPYGYYRITLPDTSYVDFETLYPDYPYTGMTNLIGSMSIIPLWMQPSTAPISLFIVTYANCPMMHSSSSIGMPRSRMPFRSGNMRIRRPMYMAYYLIWREIPLRPASSLSPIPPAISSGLRCIAIARRMPTPSPRYITICAPM